MEDKPMEDKIVILHGFTPEEAVQVMRAVRGTSSAASDAAFASSTETNLDWKLSYLIEHVSEEHRLFKEMKAKEAAK
jgi:hypothetical protein